MTVDVLAIGAHPDDVEITCGGLLIKHRQLNYTVGVVDLTRGEMGTRGTVAVRAREAAAASRVMGLAVRENVKLPDGRIQVTQDAIRKLGRIIRRLKPRVIVLPHWQGRHPDHYTASELGWRACYCAGLRHYDHSLPPFRPFKVLFTIGHQQATPSFVVDITGQMDLKMQAIACYRSQFTDQPAGREIFPTIMELEGHLRARDAHYGSLIRVRYGEPYVMKEMAQVDDLMAMPVRSM